MLTIGAIKFKAARERKGLTQGAAAELLGLSQQTISRIESGDIVPSKLKMLEGIREKFGVGHRFFSEPAAAPPKRPRQRRSPAAAPEAA